MQKYNKKGQTIGDVGSVIIALFGLALVVVGIFAGSNAIKNSSLFTANSQGANDTTKILDNISTAGSSFFGNTGTFVSILVVVIIFSFIGLLIVGARKFQESRSTVG